MLIEGKFMICQNEVKIQSETLESKIETEPRDFTKETETKLKSEISNDITNRLAGVIYKIINKIDGKYYVGSSIEIKRRWRNHRNCLRSNKHHNNYLQNAWNKYGPETFDFVIVEADITEKDLLLTEQKYLDVAKEEKDKCYNMSFIAGKVEATDDVRKKRHNASLKRTIYRFYNTATNEIYEGTQFDFYTKHNLNERRVSSVICGKKRSVSGWMLESKLNERKGKHDKTIYTFKHIKSGKTFTGIQHDFRLAHNLIKSNLCRVIKGERKSIGGWILTQNEAAPS